MDIAGDVIIVCQTIFIFTVRINFSFIYIYLISDYDGMEPGNPPGIILSNMPFEGIVSTFHYETNI
jgi:hypothetical protein